MITEKSELPVYFKIKEGAVTKDDLVDIGFNADTSSNTYNDFISSLFTKTDIILDVHHCVSKKYHGETAYTSNTGQLDFFVPKSILNLDIGYDKEGKMLYDISFVPEEMKEDWQDQMERFPDCDLTALIAVMPKETQKPDMIVSPKHYQLFPEFNLEIKDINKRILDNMEESGFDITLYEAGWYQQSMQYFERFYLKNGIEDLKKGIQTMQFVIDSMEQRKKE